MMYICVYVIHDVYMRVQTFVYTLTNRSVYQYMPHLFMCAYVALTTNVQPSPTGKSTMTVQFVEGKFVEEYSPTIESTFNKEFNFGGRQYSLNILDTAGHADEHSPFNFSYTMGVDGYILVYSVTSKQSFDSIALLNDKLLDKACSSSVPRLLVGNKTDLPNR